jgi:hypothetical protein
MYEEIMTQFNERFKKKDFLIGKSPITEYFIVTVKLEVGNYKVLILRDFVNVLKTSRTD